MALLTNAGQLFPPKSVVETLFGNHDIRLPSIITAKIQNEIDIGTVTTPTTSTRHAVDPLLPRYPPAMAAPPNREGGRVKSIRSRSYPIRKNAIFQDELPYQNPKEPKKQPNISVPSHIIPPRSRPKCRWEVKPILRNPPLGAALVPARTNKPTTQPKKLLKATETGGPWTANSKNVKQKFGTIAEKSFHTDQAGKGASIECRISDEKHIWSSPTIATVAINPNYQQKLTQLQNKFNNGNNCHNCTTHEKCFQESREIISVKDQEISTMKKELQRTSVYNTDLKSLVLEQCEDLRKSLCNSKRWKSYQATGPTSESGFSISKLVDKGYSLDLDPDEVMSTPTSDFRLKRHVAWLKEQQGFLPGSLSKELPKHEMSTKDVSKNYGNKLNSRKEFEEIVTLHLRREPGRLKSKVAELKPLEKMEEQDSRPGSRSILKVDVKSRARSVPSPIFRFQFGNPSVSEPTLGFEREIKYLRIALAARQSFLKELRHRVHKAHTIFTRHHIGTASELASTERFQELLDSHDGFVKWLYNYILKGTHDIQKFDDLNIFVNEQKELKYYFETMHNHNGTEYAGIFVPIPFNKQLISEVIQRNTAKMPAECATKSVGCQCVGCLEPNTRHPKNYFKRKNLVTDGSTQTRNENIVVSETRVMQIQTSKLSTTENKHQTSPTSPCQEIPQTRTSKSRSIFKLVNPDTVQVISPTERIDRNLSIRTESEPFDELSICNNISENALNHHLNTIFSSSKLNNGICEKPDNEVETFFFSGKKSVSFRDDESKAEDHPTGSALNSETTVPISSRTYPSLSATSITGTATKSDYEALSKDDENYPVERGPVKVRASITEENIRKKIESITDMIRQFRSESFKSAGYEIEDSEAHGKVPHQEKSNVTCNRERSILEQEYLDNVKNANNNFVIENSLETETEPTVLDDSQEFFSLTKLGSKSRTDTGVPNVICKSSLNQHDSTKFEGGTNSTSGISNSLQNRPSYLLRNDVPAPGIEPINITLGKSFKILNDNNLTANSVAPIFGDDMASAKSEVKVLPSPTVFTQDSESFLQTHLERLRSELLTSQLLDKRQNVPTQVQNFQAPETMPGEIQLQDTSRTSNSVPHLPSQSNLGLPVTEFPNNAGQAKPVGISTIKTEIVKNATDETTNESKVPQSPVKSKIPILKSSRKPRPSLQGECKFVIGKDQQRPNLPDKSICSKSNPSSPRTKVPPPKFYSPRLTNKRLTLVVQQPAKMKESNAPALSPRTAPAEKRILPISKPGRFGFQTNTTKTQPNPTIKETMLTESSNLFNGTKIPNPFSTRNRNLQESCSPSLTIPGIFLSNPRVLCNYTTEYGASFNRHTLRSAQPSNQVNTSASLTAPLVRSKTLAANFDFKAS